MECSFGLLTGGVYVSGILSMMSCGCLVLFSILSIIQLAMITSRDKVVLKYKTCIICKLALSIIAGKSKLIDSKIEYTL